MRLIVLFDLPVTTAQGRKAAADFRKFLINDGYTMLQYSVYIRICNGSQAADKHRGRLRAAVPANGSVRLLVVTERQYAAMEILTGALVEADRPAFSSQLCLF